MNDDCGYAINRVSTIITWRAKFFAHLFRGRSPGYNYFAPAWLKSVRQAYEAEYSLAAKCAKVFRWADCYQELQLFLRSDILKCSLLTDRKWLVCIFFVFV
jgi:hypothetical protein